MKHLLWTLCWLKFWILAIPLAIITLGYAIYNPTMMSFMRITKEKADFYLK